MDRAHWERLQTLFHGAAELPVGERTDYLRRRCGDDEDLVAEVLEILAEDADGSSTLDGDLGRLAEDVLGVSRIPALPTLAFGPYRLEAVLGEGGMGIVYLARRSDLGSRAAIKVLRDAWLSPLRRERFAAEQRTLAQLIHPAIAQLHDAGSLPDGTPWFVMEYVEGVPLTEYCQAHRTTIEGRLELFRAVCGAVQYAHGQAVIHRDLKPSNILVKSDGTVKLLDFGIAKHVESLDGAAEEAQTELRWMTPAYAAPEQLRGGRIGIHTDVYSLGVILYELFASRPPFDFAGRTAVEATALVLESEPERPSVVARRHRREAGAGPGPPERGKPAWPDLDVLCLTAMHRDPERRYPTVEALIRDVDHYLAGDPLEARPDALGYRLGKLLRRHRTAATAAGVVFLTVLSVVAFYTWRLATARDSAEDEAQRTARIQRFMLDLFEGGDVAGPADELRVVTLVERGVQEAAALEGEPEVQAELYRTLGGIYQKLGDFDEAERLLEGALDGQRRRFGAEHPEAAATQVALGLLRVDQARFDEGERLVREGRETLLRSGGSGHARSIQALVALGKVLEARGRYDEAIQVNEEAVALLTGAGEASAELTAALGQLADCHFYAGHYEEADALNQRVLESTRRIYGPRHPRVADVLINLGASLADRGRHAEAEAYYRPALEILEAFHGPDHFRSASARTMLGRVLVYQQRFDEGVPLLTEALRVQELVHGPVHPRVASALNDLGSAALQQGRLDEAEERFRRMREIYGEVYEDEHYLMGVATSNLASVLAEKGEYARAEELYRAALGIYERTLSPTHLNAGIARIKLGRTLLRQERLAEAEQEMLAGYGIVQAQASPSVSWLRSARADLVAVYEALEQPDRAAEFRAELAAADTP